MMTSVGDVELLVVRQFDSFEKVSKTINPQIPKALGMSWHDEVTYDDVDLHRSTTYHLFLYFQ